MSGRLLFFGRALSYSVLALSMSGNGYKKFPFIKDFIFGKSQKSLGAESVEYGGCGQVGIIFHQKDHGSQARCGMARCRHDGGSS